MTTHELALEPTPRAPGEARRWVRDRLAALGRTELTEQAELLTSEVVTNAVLHAGTPIRLLLRPDAGGVRVDVQDGSTAQPVRRHHSSLSAVGRGLALLDELAGSWGWSPDGQGKSVWFLVTPDSPDRDGRNDARLESALGTTAGSPSPGEGGQSGLGRYAPPGPSGRMVDVRLLGVPVQLLVAGQEHHDALIREFRLIALGGGPAGADPDFAMLVEELGVRYGRTRGRRDQEIEDAVHSGVLQIDQAFQVPVGGGTDLERLGVLLDRADHYCRENQLLTLVRPPLVRSFSDWYRTQVLRQLAGDPPTPWSGPLVLT
jgi:anti-sigma regulatory factor (Ser/Thr protein kinase)